MVVIDQNSVTIGTSLIQDNTDHLKIDAGNIFLMPYSVSSVGNKVDLDLSNYTDFLIETAPTIINFTNIQNGQSGKLIFDVQCTGLSWTINDSNSGIHWENSITVTDIPSIGKIINYHVFDSDVILFSYS